jgi:N-acyl homoserine lactone hydrolase
MKSCTIHPIPLWISPSDKSHMTYFVNLNQPIFVTGYIWYIEGTKEKILVDSGGDAEYLANAGLSIHEIQTLDSGLNEVGITANDVTLIIQTHLHFDHVGLASRFPNARVIVQKRELEFARNPHPIWEWLYDQELFDNLKFEVIDGDFQISEDVKVLFTPGHSPGSQSVSVRTENGMAIIAGLCSILDNYNPPVLPDGRTVPVIAPELHSDLFEAYDSLIKIKEMADILLPLHEPAFLKKKVIP